MDKSNKNSATVELLSEMYRNATMGSENLTSVIPMIKDKFLLSNVTNQIEAYAGYARDAENQLKKLGVKPKEEKMMKKLMSRGGIAINTMFDSSDSHIAEMIEKGTRMGVEQLENKKSELTRHGCESEAEKLCVEMISFERKEEAKIKDFI